eukprot:NODE_10566_length_1343_cov_3.597862.p1 GENE.NODE_10566_length_1343_cov_3.597862~~NODE_10566_length_1343_cov_3.597862.p1  ORF type:complete len:200 (-),score=9.20 NODE_10566_length_1343_cov_3.597862:656-1255(-)
MLLTRAAAPAVVRRTRAVACPIPPVHCFRDVRQFRLKTGLDEAFANEHSHRNRTVASFVAQPREGHMPLALTEMLDCVLNVAERLMNLLLSGMLFWISGWVPRWKRRLRARSGSWKFRTSTAQSTGGMSATARSALYIVELGGTRHVRQEPRAACHQPDVLNHAELRGCHLSRLPLQNPIDVLTDVRRLLPGWRHHGDL